MLRVQIVRTFHNKASGADQTHQSIKTMKATLLTNRAQVSNKQTKDAHRTRRTRRTHRMHRIFQTSTTL